MDEGATTEGPCNRLSNSVHPEQGEEPSMGRVGGSMRQERRGYGRTFGSNQHASRCGEGEDEDLENALALVESVTKVVNDA